MVDYNFFLERWTQCGPFYSSAPLELCQSSHGWFTDGFVYICSSDEFEGWEGGKKKGRVRDGFEEREVDSELILVRQWRVLKIDGRLSGSCWSFSTTGAIEAINAIVTGDLISLSEQELVDCDTTNNYGCEGGDMDYAFQWVISNGGLDTESDYPYTGVDGTCNTAKEEKKVVSIDGYEDIDQSDSALLCATVQQPISVGMDGSALDFQLYTGGIYDGDCSDDPNDIDHAVLIVGYGSENGEDYWIVKNSWGTEWGMEVSSPPSPPPPPSPPSPPPPPPSPPPPCPQPSDCGDSSFCPSDETCCCILKLFSSCIIYGCCPYENAVCCAESTYCCPSDYPICDVDDGLCLRGQGDHLGVAARRRHMATYKFPWTKLEGRKEANQPVLQWKRSLRCSALNYME
ncbi:CYSTEINE PROTEASE FAMILY C1-RELATED [Salix purpurea]|uniref:CYSTEINE PROTEASE FAMILY C1-RELATED n=1 Tax=Salix purpurea TaxID=77065 RepID=A0A9Q0WMD9_SALPP|nr:CYSTEINE PROTEASE FAMILY C1-RELATED [Salix purpurea]